MHNRPLAYAGLGAVLVAVSACSSPERAAAAYAESVIETPFRFVKNQLLVDVMIGEEGPFTFLVDTGVTPSGVDTELALSLGLPIDEDNAGSAAGLGSQDVRIFETSIAGLTVAGAAIEELPAVAFPFAGLSEKIGEPLHGVLGYAFLNKRTTRVDYVAHRIAFAASPAPFEAEISAAEFTAPLEFGAGDILPIVEVSIGDDKFIASIDTGSSLGIEIFADAVEKLDLSSTVEGWERSEVMGARGVAEILDGSLPRLAIGPLSFADVPASIGPRRGGDYRDGNIGNQMWRGYVVIFDYLDRRVAFSKAGD